MLSRFRRRPRPAETPGNDHLRRHIGLPLLLPPQGHLFLWRDYEGRR